MPSITPDLLEATRAFFGVKATVEPFSGPLGFSGSDFLRVEADGIAWCLRRWPMGVARNRLRFIHEVLIHSRTHGFSGVPRLAVTDAGETIVERNGALVDAQEWVRGEPLSGQRVGTGATPNVVCPLPPSQLKALADAIARFHLSTAGLRPPDGVEPLSLAARLAEGERGIRETALVIRERSEADEELRAVAARWLQLLPRAIALAGARLERCGTRAERRLVVCHGDLWDTHVYFTESTLTGLIDFEGLALDTPVVDLAQLILHFNGWIEREAVLRVYGDQARLTADDEALLPVAAVIDLAGEAAWALRAQYGASAQPGHREVHATNLRALLRSLESVIATLEAS